MIFDHFRRKKANAAVVNSQYQLITESAREPQFYLEFNVPDTVMGRFNMVSLFMTLYLRRTNNADEGVKQLAQDVVDEFFKDIDHSIRELGIGDAGVPKRMKKLGRMFYGRAETYGKALDAENNDELKDAIFRNLFSDDLENDANMMKLAEHISTLDKALVGVSNDELIAGQLMFQQIDL